MDQRVKSSFYVDGILIQGSYTEESLELTKNFATGEGDIFLTSYPRTGTTWTQNILVGLLHGRDFLSTVDQDVMDQLFPYMEYFRGEPSVNVASRKSPPRLLKTHLPYQLATTEMFTKKRKNIVLLRNPKDTALSYYRFHDSSPSMKPFQSPSKEHFLDRFLRGEVNPGSWCTWSRDWIRVASEHKETTLLVHYEDLQDNFVECVTRISAFVGSSATRQDIEGLADFLNIDLMKARYEKEKGFVGSGRRAGWVDEMPTEFVTKFDQKTKELLGDYERLELFL